jgi:hypothetical protein
VTVSLYQLFALRRPFGERVKLVNCYSEVAIRPLLGDDDRVDYSAVWAPENDNPSLWRFLSLARMNATQQQSARPPTSASDGARERRARNNLHPRSHGEALVDNSIDIRQSGSAKALRIALQQPFLTRLNAEILRPACRLGCMASQDHRLSETPIVVFRSTAKLPPGGTSTHSGR